VGGASIQKAQFLTPSVAVGSSAIVYPPPFFMPEVTCGDAEATISEDGTSMTPGNWGEEVFPPEGVTALEPGAYCLAGDFIVDAGKTLTATDVVFQVTQGKVDFNGQANINLGAPTSGDYFGLLLFLPLDNANPVLLDGGVGSTLRGTILAPASKITLSGSSPQHEYHSQIIGYTLEVKGQHKVDLIYKNSENFDSLSMPEVQLSE
jgi:hypothetical protein